MLLRVQTHTHKQLAQEVIAKVSCPCGLVNHDNLIPLAGVCVIALRLAVAMLPALRLAVAMLPVL